MTSDFRVVLNRRYFRSSTLDVILTGLNGQVMMVEAITFVLVIQCDLVSLSLIFLANMFSD